MSNWRQIKLVFIVALAWATLGANVIAGQGGPTRDNRRTTTLDGREVVEGEVIVRFRSGTSRSSREHAKLQAESDETESVGSRGWQRMRSGNLTTRDLIKTLRANPDIELVEPNYVIRANALPNDPLLGSQYSLINTGQTVLGNPGTPGADIDAQRAWNLTTGSRRNIVAILDTGIDYNHPDLAANMFTAPHPFSVTVGSAVVSCAAGTHGYNAITNACDPLDNNGHGTHTAGVIGAVGNNGRGMSGVNWTASMMAVKVLDQDGKGTVADSIEAIEWLIKVKTALGADANVRVLNASWSAVVSSAALDDQIAAANNANMLFVASAGAQTSNNDVVPNYPSSSPNANVISVAAVDHNGQLAAFSNFGATSVDLGAPGVEIVSTYPNDQYIVETGTSMAASHVSGAAALVLSACELSTAALKSTLLSTVDPDASLTGRTTSGGRLNVYAALVACRGAGTLQRAVTAEATSPSTARRRACGTSSIRRRELGEADNGERAGTSRCRPIMTVTVPLTSPSTGRRTACGTRSTQ
jgi:subtilisin family serine protease